MNSPTASHIGQLVHFRRAAGSTCLATEPAGRDDNLSVHAGVDGLDRTLSIDDRTTLTPVTMAMPTIRRP
jgi:hypothetical protein